MIPETYISFAGVTERACHKYDGLEVQNPVTGAITTINWIDLGYADLGNLDGLDNTVRSVVASGIDQASGEPVSIMVNDQQTEFLNVPFFCSAEDPTAFFLMYNPPAVPGTVYDVIVVSKTPTGADTAMDTWTERVVSKK